MHNDAFIDNKFPYLKENEYFCFPDAENANRDGIVAVGGNLSPGMLLSAYRQGIFPWFSENDPILWWSPDPRFVLFSEKLHIPKSAQKQLRKILKDSSYKFTLDNAFPEVIKECRTACRKGQPGTWITEDMQKAYCLLHELGYAHSVEIWKNKELIGGLYGISLGNCFFGESMFSKETNASKMAFIKFIKFLHEKGFHLIDCQVYTNYLESLGAEEIPREKFLHVLEEGLKKDTVKGSWVTAFNDFQ